MGSDAVLGMHAMIMHACALMCPAPIDPGCGSAHQHRRSAGEAGGMALLLDDAWYVYK